MWPVKARGVTLVELLITLTLVGFLGGMGVGLVRGAAIEVRRGVRSGADARAARALATLLRYELADGHRAEVSSAGPALLQIHRQIGSGAVCAASLRSVTLARGDWLGVRSPEGGRDEARLLDAQSGWVLAYVVGTDASLCPDGRIGMRLTTDRDLPEASFVRVQEPVQLRVYRSGGADWLGMAPADGSSSIQPFAGPLASSTGRFVLASDRLEFGGTTAGGGTLHLTIPLTAARQP